MQRTTLSSMLLVCFCMLIGTASAAVSRSFDGEAVTPVQKVIELLSGMLAKGKEEKHAEEVAFGKFAEFCSLQSAEKKRYIAKAADDIQELEADITKAEADASKLGDEIEKLQGEIAGWDAEAKESSVVRKQEQSTYDAAHQDYSESISALKRAIQTLKSASKDVPQSKEEEASLAQLRHLAANSRVPSSAKRALVSFLQELVAVKSGAPEANAYEFQSSGVVDMLEKLEARFKEELEVIQKEEINRKHAYQMLMQSLQDDTEYAEATVSKKAAAKASRLHDAATAKGDLAETKRSKEADEKYLQEMTATCHKKSEEFEARQVLRQEELQAIQKAIEIISSPAVSGAAEQHLPGAALMQATVSPATMFAQLQNAGSASIAGASAQVRAATLLRQRAEKAQSGFLLAIAARMTEDPFAKVTKMIKDLLVRLMTEAEQEADHKGWCDKELATNKLSRDDLTASVEALTASIDELTAKEAKLKKAIAELNEEVKDIDEAVATATKDRQSEKETNTATIADAKAAQEAVIAATKVLQEFYGKAADATALLQGRQTPAEDLPTTWDSSYTGMQGSSKGILGMLEVIQSDFARLEASTSTEEDQGQREYESFMEESAVNKAVMEKEARHNGFELTRTVRALGETKKELEGTQEELTAALATYDKLKPACIDAGVSYTERVQKRQEEIQSLKEALKILEGEDLSGGVA